MNDLRSPLEDRPYRPASPQFGQQNYLLEANPSSFSSKFKSLRQHRFFPLGSVIAAVLVFGVIISYAYNQGSQSGVNATTPVVTASNEDYKSKPANPGGMDVPFQDAVVFDQLQSKQTANAGDKVESLLPAPETPATGTTTNTNASATTPAKTTAPATATTAANTTANTNAGATAANDSEDSDVPVASANATTAAPTAATTASNTTASADQDAPVAAKTAEIAKPAATKTAKTTTASSAKKMASIAPASTTPAAKISSGSYRIQLGAFHDEAAAKTAWSKLKGDYSSQLAAVTPAFPKADLGAKGTFYRVQGVNLSKASADSICGRLNAAKSGSCIVAK